VINDELPVFSARDQFSSNTFPLPPTVLKTNTSRLSTNYSANDDAKKVRSQDPEAESKNGDLGFLMEVSCETVVKHYDNMS
jgi:hypothetical protein